MDPARTRLLNKSAITRTTGGKEIRCSEASFTPHTFNHSLRRSSCVLVILFIRGSCFPPSRNILKWLPCFGQAGGGQIYSVRASLCAHTPSVMRGGQCMLFPGSCQWHTDLSAWTPHLQSSVTHTTALRRKRAECQCLSSLTGTFPERCLSVSLLCQSPAFSFPPISICMDMEMSSNTSRCCPLTSPM